MLYKFRWGYNVTEATKSIYWLKGEGIVDHSTVTRSFKKFSLGCKKPNDQARSGKPKTIDSKAVLQAVEANPASNTWKVSSKLSIPQFKSGSSQTQIQ